MKGFRNSTRMQSGHDFSKLGQTVGRVQRFATGGPVHHAHDKIDTQTGNPQVDPMRSDMHGHSTVQREIPTSQFDAEHGGKSPLRPGYAKGGAKHFHVHKHYHSGGKVKTVSKSYGAETERAAEREVEGAGPMMSKGGKYATGGTRDKLAKGGKPFGNIKKGALHKDMGIAKGKKIPVSKLRSKLAHDKATHNTKGIKRDVFALNAKTKFHHAEGGHIHDSTHVPHGGPDYATGGTINTYNAGGAAYGGMATGGTANPLAAGGMPVRPGSAPLGALAALRGPSQGLPMPAHPAALPARPTARPLMRAGGGGVHKDASQDRPMMQKIAKEAVSRHVAHAAPTGHRGLGRMLKKA